MLVERIGDPLRVAPAFAPPDPDPVPNRLLRALFRGDVRKIRGGRRASYHVAAIERLEDRRLLSGTGVEEQEDGGAGRLRRRVRRRGLWV